ncbi:hypothetical protein DMA11_12205 [Marinilabiliaceae bacterium JC017]|nr:hypothetical protein DMA11_12205 [Marinilabiliaceae bacterium JC017]
MPRFDRTGPEGQGPRTGRKMGKCNSDNNQSGNGNNFMDREIRRGLERGIRRGLERLFGRGSGRSGKGRI